MGLDPDVSLADMYRWKVSAYAPCSSTCTTGEPVYILSVVLKMTNQLNPPRCSVRGSQKPLDITQCCSELVFRAP